MDSSLIRAQGFLDLNIFNTLILSGSVAFELGPTETVILEDSSSVEVTTMTIGAANINGFIGVDGPYWNDLDGDHEVSFALNDGTKLLDVNGDGIVDVVNGFGDLNGNGVVDEGETAELDLNAIGLAIVDLDAGIVVMASVDTPAVFLAADIDIHSFGLVGIDAFTATGTLTAQVNLGFGVAGVKAIDWQASFPDTSGFEVNTGDPASPVLLDMEGTLVSFGLAGTLSLLDFFELTGAFLFEGGTGGLKVFAWCVACRSPMRRPSILTRIIVITPSPLRSSGPSSSMAPSRSSSVGRSAQRCSTLGAAKYASMASGLTRGRM